MEIKRFTKMTLGVHTRIGVWGLNRYAVHGKPWPRKLFISELHGLIAKGQLKSEVDKSTVMNKTFKFGAKSGSWKSPRASQLGWRDRFGGKKQPVTAYGCWWTIKLFHWSEESWPVNICVYLIWSVSKEKPVDRRNLYIQGILANEITVQLQDP